MAKINLNKASAIPPVGFSGAGPMSVGWAFESDVANAFRSILRSMELFCCGLDTNGPNFKETPARVARAYSEIFAGLFDRDQKVKEILSKTFPAKSEEMINVEPIQVWSMCPHH